MTEKFTASNGVIIRPGKYAAKITTVYTDEDTKYFGRDVMEALEEYFLAKRDKELGRWRDKDYPEYVVYPKQESVIELEPGVRVVNETTGRSKDIGREVIGACDAVVSRPGKVAQAYFKAHEPLKPWLDAKPGEVWVVTTRNVADEVAVRVAERGGTFVYNDGPQYDIYDPRFETGRRIWPEGETND